MCAFGTSILQMCLDSMSFCNGYSDGCRHIEAPAWQPLVLEQAGSAAAQHVSDGPEGRRQLPPESRVAFALVLV